MQLREFASKRWKLESKNHSQPRPAAYVRQEGLHRERNTFGSNVQKHTKAIFPASGLQKLLMKEQGGQPALEVWFSQGCH